MTTPIIAGASVAALALTGRAAILSFEAWRKAPPRMRKFYDGGFEPEMTKREAALILGVRESAAKDKVLAAHRKVMIANHPDAGGSDYIATKIKSARKNEVIVDGASVVWDGRASSMKDRKRAIVSHVDGASKGAGRVS